MPVMNGWECLKALKHDVRYAQVPVIMISTSSHQREMDISISLGVLCYFIKPNYFRDLTSILKVIIDNLESDLRDIIVALKTSGCKDIFI
jgi:PleD family two-component response regulator